MSFYGDVERALANLYPYRWLFTAIALVLFLGLMAFAYRRGWHLIVRRHWRLTAIVAMPVVGVAIFGGLTLLAPLFINVTVEEEFPFASAAVLPPDVSMVEAESIMAGMAKVNQEVSEAMPNMAAPPPVSDGATAPEPTATPTPRPTAVKLKSGSFRDADSFHRGMGSATIYRGSDDSLLLRLEDFQVTNGPDLHVLLSPHEDPTTRDQVKQAGYVGLGQLKGNIGNQNYTIPEDVDVDAQRSVIIYCMPFHVIFSVAPLQDAS